MMLNGSQDHKGEKNVEKICIMFKTQLPLFAEDVALVGTWVGSSIFPGKTPRRERINYNKSRLNMVENQDNSKISCNTSCPSSGPSLRLPGLRFGLKEMLYILVQSHIPVPVAERLWSQVSFSEVSISIPR